MTPVMIIRGSNVPNHAKPLYIHLKSLSIAKDTK